MRKVLVCLMVVFMASFMLAGCAGDVVPEGADYNMFTGSMESEEPGTITEVHAATVKALRSLELPISYDKKDNLVAVVQTFTAEGDSIRITLSYRTVDMTMLEFTSEDGIDKYKLSGLLEEIRKNMSVI